jgi:hypothetical protein
LVSASEINLYKYHSIQIIDFKNARHIGLAVGHYIYRNHPDLTVKNIKELTVLNNNGITPEVNKLKFLKACLRTRS